MKIYWSIDFIPELSDIDVVIRGKIWRKCLFRSFRRWQVWTAALLVLTLQTGLWKLGKILFGPSKPAYDMLWSISNLSICILLLNIVTLNLLLPCMKNELKQRA